jgi:hypothetical protein
MILTMLLIYLLSGLCPSSTINFYSDFHLTGHTENNTSRAQTQDWDLTGAKDFTLSKNN